MKNCTKNIDNIFQLWFSRNRFSIPFINHQSSISFGFEYIHSNSSLSSPGVWGPVSYLKCSGYEVSFIDASIVPLSSAFQSIPSNYDPVPNWQRSNIYKRGWNSQRHTIMEWHLDMIAWQISNILCTWNMPILYSNCDSIDTPHAYPYPTFAISEWFCKSNPFYKYWNSINLIRMFHQDLCTIIPRSNLYFFTKMFWKVFLASNNFPIYFNRCLIKKWRKWCPTTFHISIYPMSTPALWPWPERLSGAKQSGICLILRIRFFGICQNHIFHNLIHPLRCNTTFLGFQISIRAK